MSTVPPCRVCRAGPRPPGCRVCRAGRCLRTGRVCRPRHRRTAREWWEVEAGRVGEAGEGSRRERRQDQCKVGGGPPPGQSGWRGGWRCRARWGPAGGTGSNRNRRESRMRGQPGDSARSETLNRSLWIQQNTLITLNTLITSIINFHTVFTAHTYQELHSGSQDGAALDFLLTDWLYWTQFLPLYEISTYWSDKMRCTLITTFIRGRRMS